MPEACVSLLSTDACEWSIGGIWSSSDVVLRGVFLGLALMLAYTVFFAVRFSRRYYLVRRRIHIYDPDDLPNFKRANPTLLADLSPGVGVLKGIASAAPFLGLAGTCYGVTSAFFFGNVVVGSWTLFEAWFGSQAAAALVTTVAGILVAIPAAFSYSMICIRLEALRGQLSNRNRNSNDLGSFHFAQTLPLKRRFAAPPHYALLAAPILASIITLFTPFHPNRIPTGLSVAIPSRNCDHRGNDRLIVLRVMNTGKLFIDFEPVEWKDLSSRLSDIYRSRQNREIYVYAEEGVDFQNVADAIDIVRNTRAAGPDTSLSRSPC